MINNYKTFSQIIPKLLDWFDKNKRDLPFRKEKDPYKVLISEIMAQQTQISTLIPYYERFISNFPTVKDLAQADLDTVYLNWEGLGYYSRARNLHKAAKIIIQNGFPQTQKELLTLPGVGEYTSGAVASICFNEKVPAVDGNVLRVLSRVFASTLPINEPKTKKELINDLTDHLPDRAGDFNESLMELGALICKSQSPTCLICPIRAECLAFRDGLTERIPVKTKKKKKPVIEQVALIPLLGSEPLFLIREEGDLLANMSGFPVIEINESQEEAIKELKNLYNITDLNYHGLSTHHFTNKTWKTYVYSAIVEKEENGLERKKAAVPTAFKKMLNLVLTD